jgi:hypothetical protein
MTGFEHIAMAVHVTAGIQGACTVSEMSSGHQIYTAFASRETAVERAVDWLTRCTVDAKQLEQRIQTAIASPAYKEAAHGQA